MWSTQGIHVAIWDSQFLKIESVQEVTGVDERWKTQRLAHKLDGEGRQIQQLKVALGTVKPKRTTYSKKANVFFLDRRDAIVKTKQKELKEKEKKRHDVGLELRKTSQ